MTVKGLTELPLFEKKVNECLKEIVKMRKQISAKLKPGQMLRRSVYDRILEKNMFNSEAIKVLYVKILGKEAKGLSAEERSFIRSVGDEALHRAVSDLKVQEENQKIHEKAD